jgi:hypothetical protein
VRRKIQDSYGVNFGNERLAEAFDISDIPSEIQETLRRIAQLRTS